MIPVVIIADAKESLEQCGSTYNFSFKMRYRYPLPFTIILCENFKLGLFDSETDRKSFDYTGSREAVSLAVQTLFQWQYRYRHCFSGSTDVVSVAVQTLFQWQCRRNFSGSMVECVVWPGLGCELCWWLEDVPGCAHLHDQWLLYRDQPVLHGTLLCTGESYFMCM